MRSKKGAKNVCKGNSNEMPIHMQNEKKCYQRLKYKNSFVATVHVPLNWNPQY